MKTSENLQNQERLSIAPISKEQVQNLASAFKNCGMLVAGPGNNPISIGLWNEISKIVQSDSFNFKVYNPLQGLNTSIQDPSKQVNVSHATIENGPSSAEKLLYQVARDSIMMKFYADILSAERVRIVGNKLQLNKMVEGQLVGFHTHEKDQTNQPAVTDPKRAMAVVFHPASNYSGGIFQTRQTKSDNGIEKPVVNNYGSIESSITFNRADLEHGVSRIIKGERYSLVLLVEEF